MIVQKSDMFAVQVVHRQVGRDRHEWIVNTYRNNMPYSSTLYDTPMTLTDALYAIAAESKLEGAKT